MKPLQNSLLLLAALCAVCCFPSALVAQMIPSGPAIDAEVDKIMTETHAKGMAVAIIDRGKVGYVQAYGIRNAKGDPTNTVMYGASITKTVFAYTVMQLVDQGKLHLDAPIKDDLDNPLPSWPRSGLSGQVWTVQGSCRRSALGTDHAAYVPDSFDGFQ